MMSPTKYTEGNGSYLGLDKVVHSMEEEFGSSANEYTSVVLGEGDYGYGEYSTTFFSDLSLWDTFRTQHPWLLLTQPDVAVGVIRSMQQMTLQQQAFPRWVLASVESGCMLGEGGMAAVVEALHSGLSNTINAASIQSIFLKQETEPGHKNSRSDLEHYLTYGYVSQNASGDSASETMTNAFDDFLLSELSYFVGDVSSGDAAKQRSKNYANIWSPKRRFMCPRAASTPTESGQLMCPKSPIGPVAWQEYREGDALHWSWFVPHDVSGLIGLFVDSERGVSDVDPLGLSFYQALEDFFVEHVKSHEKIGSALPNPYYWAGNEHGAFVAWMFSFGTFGQLTATVGDRIVGGYCTRTQYWSRLLTSMHYSDIANGIPGNDDYGSMSSWLLFASLGLFPQAGTTNYVIGSPRVNEAFLKLDGHVSSSTVQRFVHIRTYNNSAENVFVDKLLINGVEHTSPFIDRSVLVQPGGCELEFFMTATESSGLCA